MILRPWMRRYVLADLLSTVFARSLVFVLVLILKRLGRLPRSRVCYLLLLLFLFVCTAAMLSSALFQLPIGVLLSATFAQAAQCLQAGEDVAPDYDVLDGWV